MAEKKSQHRKKSPLISVIVPIYKVEKYLNRCIDSIREQKYKNLQIILVDDGSPDKCPEICDTYAKKDTRITVIHKTNGGLSDARNAGIDRANGDYISFIDSDDYIDKEFIGQLYNLIQKYHSDISVCGYTEVFEDSREDRICSDTDKEVSLTNIEAMSDSFINQKYGHVFAWNKLYKTSIFLDNMIRYPKGKIFEDAFTTFKLFYYANRIVYSGQPLYYYLKRPDSIMGKYSTAKKIAYSGQHLYYYLKRPDSIGWHTKMELLNEMELFIHGKDLPLTKELNACFLIVNLHYIGLMASNDEFNKADWYKLRTNVLSRFPKCLINNMLPLNKKVAAIIVWFGWKPYAFASKLLRLARYNGT